MFKSHRDRTKIVSYSSGRQIGLPFLACLSKEKYDKETMLKEAMSCLECHLLCDSKRVLEQHVYMMHSDDADRKFYKRHFKFKTKCVHCLHTFTVINDLWKHVKNETCESPEDIPFQPDQKDPVKRREKIRLEKLKPEKIRREKIVTPKKIREKQSFKCPDCPEEFETFKKLKWHKWLHIPKKEFPCDQCRKSYDTKNSLRCHFIASHRDFELRKLEKIEAFNRKIPCEKCPCRFETQKELENHVLKVHEKEKALTLECPTCEKKFRLKADMNLHIGLVHEGKKRKTCSECGKLYFESDIEEHMENVHGHRKVVQWPKTEN